MDRQRWMKLIVALMLPQIAGGIGGFFSVSGVSTWYQMLAKPSFTPPGWVFGPVWTILYVMMGVSFFLVWVRDRQKYPVRFAAGLFVVHLLFNALWSVLFFGLRDPLLALVDIALLWCLISGLVIVFWRIRRAAGVLMLPYWLWVSFASVLNYQIWRMN